MLAVGTRVHIPGRGDLGQGTVAFQGQTLFGAGTWLGVALDKPAGLTDGSVNGVRYFSCQPQHGLFVQPHEVAAVAGAAATTEATPSAVGVPPAPAAASALPQATAATTEGFASPGARISKIRAFISELQAQNETAAAEIEQLRRVGRRASVEPVAGPAPAPAEPEVKVAPSSAVADAAPPAAASSLERVSEKIDSLVRRLSISGSSGAVVAASKAAAEATPQELSYASGIPIDAAAAQSAFFSAIEAERARRANAEVTAAALRQRLNATLQAMSAPASSETLAAEAFAASVARTGLLASRPVLAVRPLWPGSAAAPAPAPAPAPQPLPIAPRRASVSMTATQPAAPPSAPVSPTAPAPAPGVAAPADAPALAAAPDSAVLHAAAAEVERLQAEVKRLREEAAAAQEEVAEVRARRVAGEGEVARLRELNASLTVEKERLRTHLDAALAARDGVPGEAALRFEHQVTGLARQVAAAQAEASQTAALAEERGSRIQALTVRLAACRAETEAAEAEGRRARAANAGLDHARQRAVAEVAALRRRVAEVEAEAMAAKEAARAAEAAARAAAPTTAVAAPPAPAPPGPSLQESIELLTLRQAHAALQERARELEQEAAGLQQANAGLLSTLQEADGHLERMSSVVRALEEREGVAQRQLNDLQTSTARAATELTARASLAEARAEDLKRRLEAALAHSVDTGSRADFMRSEALAAEVRAREADEQIAALRAHASALSAEVDALRAQQSDFVRENAALRASLSRAKAVMSTLVAAKDGRDAAESGPGSLTALASALEARAVAAATAALQAPSPAKQPQQYQQQQQQPSSPPSNQGREVILSGKLPPSGPGDNGSGEGFEFHIRSNVQMDKALTLAQALLHPNAQSPTGLHSAAASPASPGVPAQPAAAAAASPAAAAAPVSSAPSSPSGAPSVPAVPAPAPAPPPSSFAAPASGLSGSGPVRAGRMLASTAAGGATLTTTSVAAQSPTSRSAGSRSPTGSRRSRSPGGPASSGGAAPLTLLPVRRPSLASVASSTAGAPAAAGTKRSGSAGRFSLGETNAAAAAALAATGQHYLPVSRARTTLPVRTANHRRVYAALASLFFSGPTHGERLARLRKAMDAHTDRQLLVAVISSGQRSGGSFGGLYVLIEEEGEAAAAVTRAGSLLDPRTVLAFRIAGSGGPLLLTLPMVQGALKYDTVKGGFREVGTPGAMEISVTTDALTLDAMYLQAAIGLGAVSGSSGHALSPPHPR